MQARVTTKLPEGPAWIYEVKLDGYRIVAVKNGADIELRSRNNSNLTASYPTVVDAVRRINAHSAVIDGEVVAVDSSGRLSFQALQHRSARSQHQIVYDAFDVLHLNGDDLTKRTLEERRAQLPRVIKDTGVLLSGELAGSAADVTAAVARLGLEGVIAKRRDSKYEAGVRSHAWVKLKLDRQQEFVGGFRPNGKSVDALLVGYYDKRALHFAGRVRAGMTPRLRALLFDQLKGLAIADCPFVDLPNSKKSHWGTVVTAEDMLEMTWVRPRVVVQIHFVEWTAEGQLRHAAFMVVREDKRASQVIREPVSGKRL